MPEFRQNFITKNWVIIAPKRAKRPSTFKKCPFCEGNERLTPKEVFALRDPLSKPNSPGWKIRVVPNKFPTFGHAKEKIKKEDIFLKKSAIGGHELIILKDHKKELPDLKESEIENLIKVFKNRYRFWRKKRFINYILIIENKGKKAGASISHPHFQLFAFSNISNSLIEKEFKEAENFFLKRKKCIFCKLIEVEKKLKKRIIMENEHFIILAPFASNYPYELLLLPKNHEPEFETISEEKAKFLAKILKEIFRKIKKNLSNPDWNLFIHNFPKIKTKYAKQIFHWHLKIIPRLTTLGGFELATEMIVNISLPEETKRILK